MPECREERAMVEPTAASCRLFEETFVTVVERQVA